MSRLHMEPNAEQPVPATLAVKVGRVLLSIFVGIPMMIVIGPVLLVVFVGAYILLIPGGLIHWRRYRRWLRRHFGSRGRLMYKAELERHIELGEGTLIVDGACKHEMNRVLWTPDRLLKSGPSPAYVVDQFGIRWATAEFIAWCRPLYTDPITGAAKVIDSGSGQWVRRLSRPGTGTDLVLLSDAKTERPLVWCPRCAAQLIPTAGRCPGCGEQLAG